MWIESPTFEVRDVDVDVGRDLVGTGAHLEAEHLLVDLPVGVADRHGVAHQVQRHLGDNRAVGVHDLEVDVRDGPAHRVALDLAGHDEEGLAVGVEADQRVEALLAGDGGAKGLGVDRDGEGLGPLAVDDGRDRAGVAQATRVTRPALGAE
jgi:hypothetical protein